MMAEDKATPPGLEALASHLGYTFVRKNISSSASSSAGDKLETEAAEKDSQTEKPKEAKAAVGSLNSFGNIYRNGPDDSWTSKEPQDTAPAEGEDTIGHAVVLRMQKSKDSRKGYEINSMVIQSPELKSALAEILDGYPGVFCNLDRLVFQAPFAAFVHRWGAFLEYMERDDVNAVTKQHITLLHEILRKELADTIKAFEDYVTNGVVTFEHAWIVFQPEAVVMVQSGPSEQIALRLKSGSYKETDDDGNFFALKCQRVDWNGKAFGWAEEHVKVPEFEGTQPIHELPVFPLAFHPRKESIKQVLIERGRRFAALAGYNYRSYDGPAIERTNDGNILIHLKGRIIIDTDSFCKQPYQCKIYTTPLNRKSKTGAVTSGENDDADDDYWPPPTTFGRGRNTTLSVKEKSEQVSAKLTDYQYMLCTPILRGYSLKEKKWLSFYVDHVQEINWSTDAFDSLVLPTSQKRLVMALSKTQAAAADNFDDMIVGKGKGMILLLSGPPGVGKTLTAEAVSESMRVPLYMLSAGDLGTRPEHVEWNLANILEIVAKWKAILLIDECDVFLEARSIHDMERNKLVSIFLRLLEYYQGTLFLTTNRVDNIDPAFQSRIHVHMKYPELTGISRFKIWSSFVEKVPTNLTHAQLEELAEVPLNGRQIKNLVKTAQLLALDDEKVLGKEHIDLVLNIENGFKEE